MWNVSSRHLKHIYTTFLTSQSRKPIDAIGFTGENDMNESRELETVSIGSVESSSQLEMLSGVLRKENDMCFENA